MPAKLQFLFMNFILLFRVGSCSAVNASCEARLKQVEASSVAYEIQVLVAFKQIFQEQQSCLPCPKCDTKVLARMKKDKAELEHRIERRTNNLISAFTATESQKLPAHVPQPVIIASLNATFNFTVESPTGEGLSLCLWERNVEGQRQMIVSDGLQVEMSSQNSPITGVSFMESDAEGSLRRGKCGLKFNVLSEQDVDTSWTCTLVTQNGTIFTGRVTIIEDVDFDSSEVDDGEISKSLINGTASDMRLASRSIFALSTALQTNLPTDKNLVFSPLSLGLTVLAARLGARGSTATQAEQVMRLTSVRVTQTADILMRLPTHRAVNVRNRPPTRRVYYPGAEHTSQPSTSWTPESELTSTSMPFTRPRQFAVIHPTASANRAPTVENMENFMPARRGFFKILEKLQKPTADHNVTMANGIFVPTGFKVDRKFRSLTRSSLNVSVAELNFTDGIRAAESINFWASNRTNGVVDELFSAATFSSETRLVLVSAFHIKSPWKYPFDPEETQKDRFYPDSTTVGWASQSYPESPRYSRRRYPYPTPWYRPWRLRSVGVDMMASEDDFPYGDLGELNAELVSIPYKGELFSMQVIVPKQGSNLQDLIRALENTTMETIRQSIREPGLCEKVRLHLPKFKIKSTLSLVEPLRKMGVTDMFSETEADFSGIPRNGILAPKLLVSEVIQKAFIEVDEEGSDAVAASGIRAGITCAPAVTEIKVDRPFYYQIVEDKTNTILLAGVVRDPNA